MELLPVAILAGGLATRLRPATQELPKALLPIAGEPFLAHQLRLLQQAGIRQVVLCAGYLGEQIRDFAGDGSRFGVEVRYSFDGETPLGTAGAIQKALPWLGETFFVLYGDSYLRCNYRDIQRAFLDSGKDALMTVYRNEGQGDRSNVEFSGGEIAAYDKSRQTPRMHYIDYGLGVFRRAVFEFPAHSFELPARRDLAAAYQDLLQRRRLAGYEVADRFYEAGSWEGIRELENYLAGGKEVAHAG